jgi:hypothetical protein
MTAAPQDWNDCPQGEIAGLVHSLKAQRRRKTLGQAAGATAAIMLVAFLGSSVISGYFRGQTPIDAIACEKVMELAPQYVARQLDGELTTQIDEHLTACEHCRTRIHDKFPRFPLPVQAVNAWNAAAVPIAWAYLAPRYQSER